MSYRRNWKKRRTGKDKNYATLDKWFSRFIRLRDTDEYGRGTCITCQKRFPFDKLDAGHYQSRAKMATRFDERNVHVQCIGCNRFNGGEKIAHGYQIAIKYGHSVKHEIDFKSSRPLKLLPYEKKELQNYYRKETRKLFESKSTAFQDSYANLVK